MRDTRGKVGRSRSRGFFTAYLVTCMVNGKQYIGVTGAPVRTRWLEHCADAMGRMSHTKFHRAIRKYGAEAFTITEIASAKIWEDACVVECALIASYGTFGPSGYNSTAGGDGTPGVKNSDETRAKKSAALKGRKPSEKCLRNLREHLDLISEKARQRKQGEKPKTKKWSAERRAKASAIRLGRKQTPGHIEKRIAPLRGKNRAVETIAKSVATKAAIRAAKHNAVPQLLVGD